MRNLEHHRHHECATNEFKRMETTRGIYKNKSTYGTHGDWR